MKSVKTSCIFLLCALFLCISLPAMAQEMSISGCAYVDDNANALCDPGEALITGVPVTLETRGDAGWENVSQAVTDAYGQYAFSDLEAGEYRLLCALNDPSFYAAGVGTSMRYADGAAVLEGITDSLTADIALRPSAAVCVEAYWDSSADGERGKFERALSGVTVEVLRGEEVIISIPTPSSLFSIKSFNNYVCITILS